MSTVQTAPSTAPPLSFGMPWIDQAQRTLTRAAYEVVQYLFNRPNYVDLAWFNPGALAVGIMVYRYPCPPQNQVNVREITAYLLVGPTVTPAVVEVWRTGLAATAGAPAVPGGKVATITWPAGFGPVGTAVFNTGQAFMYPGTDLFLICTAVGVGVPGNDLHLIVRG
jgi:hypothetical protein